MNTTMLPLTVIEAIGPRSNKAAADESSRLANMAARDEYRYMVAAAPAPTEPLANGLRRIIGGALIRLGSRLRPAQAA